MDEFNDLFLGNNGQPRPMQQRPPMQQQRPVQQRPMQGQSRPVNQQNQAQRRSQPNQMRQKTNKQEVVRSNMENHICVNGGPRAQTMVKGQTHDTMVETHKEETPVKIPEAIVNACHGNEFLQGMLVGEILNSPRFKNPYKRW